MGSRKIDNIRKRDGRVEPYAEPKIARAILAAGAPDRYLAEDLAGVVTLYLERCGDAAVPSSDDVRRVVEKVLAETGHAAAARSFVDFARAPKVAAPPSPPGLFPAVTVESASRGEVSPWDRGRIAAALAREMRLDEERAERIAAAVERRLFAMGVARVSTALVRELVNQELLGARADVLSQIVVGMPKYDVAQLVAAPPDPDALPRTIGEAALKQFALQEIFSPDVAAAHLEGRIHVHGLESPLKTFWWAPPIDGLAADARGLTAALGALQRSAEARAVASLELSPLNVAYAALDGERELDYALAEMTARPGVAVGALPPAQPNRDRIERVERAARRLAARVIERGGATVYVSPAALRHDEDLELLRAATAVPTRFVFERGGGASRYGAARVAQAVTINVAQAGYRGEGELERAVELAVRAHLDKRRLLKRLGVEVERYVVGVCGLAGADAFRTLAYVFAMVKQASEIHRIEMSIEEIDDPEPARRFARIDAQVYRADVAGYGAPVGAESRFTTLMPSASVRLARGQFAELLRVHAETLAGHVVIG